MPDTATTGSLVTLRLTVNNHPGVMSHVCGLFARRAYNLEGILVTPNSGASTCTIWLMINEDERMVQVVRQVSKLHDILDVRVEETGQNIFERLRACMDLSAADHS